MVQSSQRRPKEGRRRRFKKYLRYAKVRKQTHLILQNQGLFRFGWANEAIPTRLARSFSTGSSQLPKLTHLLARNRQNKATLSSVLKGFPPRNGTALASAAKTQRLI